MKLGIVEHLSRSGGTLAYTDVLLVVMEPSRKSVITAARTMTLAEELGIPRVYGLGNKAHLPEDGDYFRREAATQGLPLAGIIPYAPQVAEADRAGVAVTELSPEAVRPEVDNVIAFLEGAMVA